MKKIIISLSIVAAVAAVAIYATTAFFSDTETSTGNTFTAGSLDLTVDSVATYNGQLVPTSTWGLKDLGAGDLFFNLADVKPGDTGEDTISLHVNNNDACGFVTITKTSDAENTCTEPEVVAEPTCASDALGELDDATVFTIWADTCAVTPAVPGDNIYQAGCDTQLTTGTLDAVENWGIGQLIGGATTYYGMSWTLPSTVGNEVQSDSFTATMEFTIEQYRNQYGAGTANPDGCPIGEITPTPAPAPEVDGIISQGEYDGALSMPITDVPGGTVKAKTQGGFLYLAADIITDLTDNRSCCGFNDEFGVNLGESPTTDTVFLGLGSTNANGRTVGTIDSYFTNFVTTGHSLVALFTSGHRVIEWKIPLTVIPSIVNGDTLSIGGATESTDGNSVVYPIGLIWGNNVTYGQLLVQ
jgi:predicted ribosomally synthesized peptide with SipW-like signal peptide